MDIKSLTEAENIINKNFPMDGSHWTVNVDNNFMRWRCGDYTFSQWADEEKVFSLSFKGHSFSPNEDVQNFIKTMIIEHSPKIKSDVEKQKLEALIKDMKGHPQIKLFAIDPSVERDLRIDPMPKKAWWKFW